MPESAAFEPARRSSDRSAVAARANERERLADAQASRHGSVRKPQVPASGRTPPLAAPRLSADFSQIRVHTDPTAHASATAAGVRAYLPSHVTAPGGADNHTLVHRFPVGPADDAHEREAGAVARQVVGANGLPAASGLRAAPVGTAGGAPLPDALRATLEPRFGADFAGVRLHTGARADQLSSALGASAVTTGTDVFFRHGAYDPSGPAGQQLLAHELAHVVQQGGAERTAAGPALGAAPRGVAQRTPQEVRNGGLHIYKDDDGRRYRSQEGRFEAVPERVSWIDQQGRYVEELQDGTKRVLTDDAKFVRKQYVLGTDAAGNYVLPVGARDKNFMPALPNLFGGNMDPEDADANATLNREMAEESQNRYQMAGAAEHHSDQDKEGRSFHTALLSETGSQSAALPDAQGEGQQEMQREPFRFNANDIAIGKDTSDLDIRRSILAKFYDQHPENQKFLEEQSKEFKLKKKKNKNKNLKSPLQAFHDADSTAFLVEQLKAGAAYDRGLAHAQAGVSADPTEGHPKYHAAHTDYAQGSAHARNGEPNLRSSPAYEAGFASAAPHGVKRTREDLSESD